MDDRCDRCTTARALVGIWRALDGGRLQFCGHCYRVVDKPTHEAKFVIEWDRRSELLTPA